MIRDYDLYEEEFEPLTMSDEDICRLEEEIFLTISDETLNEIYWRFALDE